MVHDPAVEVTGREGWMREALVEADAAGAAGELPIGAVVVLDGEIVGRGRARHGERGTQLAHAELEALLDAREAILERHDDAILVTTLEPCPLCLGAAVMTDVPTIVFALEDALVQSTLIRERVEYVRRHIRTYEAGVLRAESRRLFERYRPDVLPHLDGRTA